MRAKLLFLISTILFAFLIITFYFDNKTKIKIQEYKINNDPSYVRIYHDPATIPSLYQVYDYLNQSDDTFIFVKWDRIRNFENKFKNNKNVSIMTYKHMYQNKMLAKILDPAPIKEYYHKHPNSKFIFHCNETWFNSILPILAVLPKDAVEEIHIYEDASYSSTYQARQFKDLSKNFEKYKITDPVFYTLKKKEYDFTIKKQQNYKFSKENVLSDYKLIYHIENTKWLNSYKCIFSSECLERRNFHKNDTLVNTSVGKLKSKLEQADPKIKEKYFKIFDFDYHKYKTIMTHPFGIFVFSLYENDDFANKQVNFMNALINGNLSYLIKNGNINWFYKEHPSKQKNSFIKILYKNPKIKQIDKQIPIELFIISDIIPDYIAGYSSSLFFNMPKNKISAYIKRPNDPYMTIIKEQRHIPFYRIFEINDIDNSNKSKFKRLCSRIFVNMIGENL